MEGIGRSRKVLCSVGLAVGLVAVSCGKSQPRPQTHAPATASPPSTPAVTDLRSELVSPSGLPAGWSSTTFPPSGMKIPDSVSLFPKAMTAVCAVSTGGSSRPDEGVNPPQTKAEAFYDRGHNAIPSFDELLAFYPGSGARAVAFFDTMLSAHCSTTDYTVHGRTFTGSIRRLSVPAVGDQSTAWEIDNPAPTGLRQAVICFRKGDKVAMVLYGTSGAEDLAGAVQQLASVAAAKIT